MKRQKSEYNNNSKIKRVRQAKILEIIERNDITTQDELTLKLREAGFGATQATVSRDIRELQLTKASDGNGMYKYTVKDRQDEESENKYAKILKEAAHTVTAASNILVVKTYSGMANAACAAIDRLGLAGVVGSIAGDDTIFMACRSFEEAVAARERLKELIEN